jgi:hypothetical protein
LAGARGAYSGQTDFWLTQKIRNIPAKLNIDSNDAIDSFV